MPLAAELRQRFGQALLDGNETGATHRQSTRLVEQNGMGTCQRFERGAAFDENSAPGGLRNPGNESDWRR